MVQSNPSGGEDWPTAIAVDSASLYVTGYENFGSSWRVEKRSLGDGTLVPGFGTGGVVSVSSSGNPYGNKPYGMAIDGASMYLVGHLASPGATRPAIVARSLGDGAPLSGFGIDGVVTPSSSGGGDLLRAVSIDLTSLYVVGIDYAPGYGEWHIEKRLR